MRYLLTIVMICFLAACTVELDEGVFWVPENLTRDDRAEAGIGLFMGRALSEPMSASFTHREYWTTKIEFRQTKEKFIPATLDKAILSFSDEGHDLATIAVTRDDSKPETPLFVHCYGIGANLYNNGIQYALKTLPYGDSVQFDLPGHGESGGAPTVQDFRAAGDAMLDHLSATYADRQIIFWGHSLGGWICADLASRYAAAKGLVIETSARNGQVVAQRWMPLLIRPLIRVRANDVIGQYDMVEMLEGYAKPILVLGAQRDRVIAEKLVAQLADALDQDGRDVQYKKFKNARHSTVAFAPGFDETVRTFLSRTGTMGVPAATAANELVAVADAE